MEISNDIIERIALAKSVAVLTGAGVSAESGVKTFRDPDGLWTKMNPQELASVDGFMNNPELVWSFYRERAHIIDKVKPNAGHYALANMEKLFPRFELITQNVDGLHAAAGSTNVRELHGNLIDNRCFDCERPFKGELPEDELPRCPECGGGIRPSVVWFGELLPADAMQAAEFAALNCGVFFSVGTSAEVYPAANFPFLAKRSGAYLIEVNPNETALTPFADAALRGTSAKVLPVLVENIEEFRNKSER